jgi:Cys-tRNA(Pro)/Cys-tRNA(Cys) deacylase
LAGLFFPLAISITDSNYMSENKPPVSLALEKLNIPHRIFTHPGPVNSLEQAARERGQRPEQVVRSILFRTGEDEYLMALVTGPAQISWKALRVIWASHV